MSVDVRAIAARWGGYHHDGEPFEDVPTNARPSLLVQAVTDIDALLRALADVNNRAQEYLARAELAEATTIYPMTLEARAIAHTVAARHAARVCSGGKDCSICDLVRALNQGAS